MADRREKRKTASLGVLIQHMIKPIPRNHESIGVRTLVVVLLPTQLFKANVLPYPLDLKIFPHRFSCSEYILVCSIEMHANLCLVSFYEGDE